MKTTQIKRVFAAVMAAAMLPVLPSVASASETPALAVNESFNDYVTNTQPDKMNVRARNWFITEDENQDKALVFYAALTGSSVKFDAGTSTDTVISFDLKATDVMPSGELKVHDSAGRSQVLMSFLEGRGAAAHNGLPLSGFGKSKSVNYTVVYRSDDKTCDFYVNGKAKALNMKMKSALAKNVVEIEFSFLSARDGQGVIIDNVNVYSDDEFTLKNFPVAEYNPDADEPMELKFGPQIGSGVLLNQTFEQEKVSGYIHSNGNTLERVEDELIEGNHSFRFERQGTGDSHFNGSGLTVSSDSVVYEFDFKILEKTSVFNLIFKDTNAVFYHIGSIKNGAELKLRDGFSKTLKLNTWYRWSVIMNFYERKTYIYLDGSLIAEWNMMESYMLNGAGLEAYRIHMTDYQGDEDVKFEIDNFRAYEGAELISGELGEIVREIDLTRKSSLFAPDTAYQSMLKGYTGIHSTSGVVYANNEKQLLKNTPVKKGTHDFMLPVEELAQILGVPVEVNGTSALFNNETVSGEIHNGVLYVNDDDLFKATKKVITKIPATYNANMVVLGSSSFPVPEKQTEIDALNNYLLYYRPTPAQFKELYNESELAGVHPRIQFTQEDFDRMVALTETDPNMMYWKDQVIAAANSILGSDLPKHELYDGLRMNCQRLLSKNIHALAVAYYITKDQRYLDRAYAELETVATFPDWNPGHHLDTCEMMAAFAVGYDWLYNFFTPEQREILERGIMNNGFYDSWLGMLSSGSTMGSAFYMTNNHGTVDNGALLMAAVAFMDVYPEEAAWLGSHSFKGMELNIYQWAPEGVWYEGIHYWELTMQFTAKWLDTLESFFVTDLGMGNLEGLDMSVITELQAQTDYAIYNFADAIENHVFVPEMFYLANKYNVSGVYQKVIDSLDHRWLDDEDLGLGMMWYDPEMAAKEAELDLDFMMESIDTFFARDAWDTAEPTYVGIHAGETNLDHSQLDAGSFIYETGGVRFAQDPGMGDYNSLGYFERQAGGNRWIHLRNRAEAHNTIVVNPEGRHEDHIVDSFADQTIVQQKPRGVITTVDMSQVLYDVSKATRGFAFTDDRQSLVIRDELTLGKNSNVYWFLQSTAAGTIDGNSIILERDGISVKVEWTSSAPVTAKYEPIKALPSSPEQIDKWNGSGFNRLELLMNTNGEANITVKITPLLAKGTTSLAEWDKPISTWNIPDGKIPQKPVIDTINVAGQNIEAGKKSIVKYSVVEGDYAVPPAVSVSSDKYNVEIKQAASFDDVATVTVIDKNDATNVRIYTVVCEVIKAPVSFPGKTSIPVRSFKVSEEPQTENPGINLFDGNQATRWSAEFYGQWIEVDLGSVQKIDDIVMSFYLGHQRSMKLTFAISNDGVNWEPIWNGLSNGLTEDYEFFNVGGVNARYVKIGCNGTTTGTWNSVSELVFTRNN